MTSKFEEWLHRQDLGIEEWENPLIKARFEEVKHSLKIVEGNLEDDMPNEILVDITHLADPDFQPGKRIIVNLALFIRPCPCSDCQHKWQYECYLKDCPCCQDECT